MHKHPHDLGLAHDLAVLHAGAAGLRRRRRREHHHHYQRGLQLTGSDGTCTFTTIVPGCDDGRVPRMHFEIYRSANTAAS